MLAGHESGSERKHFLELFAEREKELAELKDTLQRLQAEFENYGKRIEKEKASFRQFAAAGLAKELLPVLDSFESALAKKNGGSEKEGLEKIYVQLFGVLEKQGLKRMDCLGKEFDPELHECVAKESIEGKDDDIIVEEIHPGYSFNGKTLRTAKVKINKIR